MTRERPVKSLRCPHIPFHMQEYVLSPCPCCTRCSNGRSPKGLRERRPRHPSRLQHRGLDRGGGLFRSSVVRSRHAWEMVKLMGRSDLPRRLD